MGFFPLCKVFGFEHSSRGWSALWLVEVRKGPLLIGWRVRRQVRRPTSPVTIGLCSLLEIKGRMDKAFVWFRETSCLLFIHFPSLVKYKILIFGTMTLTKYLRQKVTKCKSMVEENPILIDNYSKYEGCVSLSTVVISYPQNAVLV